MIKENLDRLKRSGFEIERTPTGYAFTLRPKEEFVDLYVGKEECELIQEIGKILEIRLFEGPQLRVTVLSAIIGTG